MTKGAKMFLTATARNRPERDRSRETRMEREPKATRWMPPYYGVEINRYEYGPHEYTDRESPMRGSYDMDSRFRDRRGREHYDDGRFAPMSRMDAYEMEGRRMNPIGFDRYDNHEMRMGGSDASLPHHREMDRMPGNRAQSGGARFQRQPRFDEQMAMEWTAAMENADGTTGPHWSMEQIEKVMRDKRINLDPVQFFAAVNMIYSDYVEVAKKRNLNSMDFYADMAKAFLHDKDAGAEDKLAAYYEYVVKG